MNLLRIIRQNDVSFLEAKFSNPEFRGSPRTSAVNTERRIDSENLTNNPRYLRNGERFKIRIVEILVFSKQCL